MTRRVDEAISMLERTPRTLDAWLRGLDAAWLEGDEGPGTWSPRRVVGHLVYGEDADWIPRARIILEHGEARAFDPFDREGMDRTYGDLGCERLLDLFAAKRAASLATLASFRIGARELALRGRHPELGSVTLEQLLATWVVHDTSHVAQIARVLTKRWKPDVGPWSAYFSLLR